MVDKAMEKMPNVAPDGPLETEKKSVLSPVGDPLGQVLDKGLKPLGSVTGAVAKPSGEALLGAEKQAKEEVGYAKSGEPGVEEERPDKEKPGGERIGGKAQTGQNPLGL